MKWLWFVGPVTALFVYLFATLRLPPLERRRLRELERWLDEVIGPLILSSGSGSRGTRTGTRSRRVAKLPPAFEPMTSLVGGGAPVADAVLVPKLAYLAVRAAGATASSAHQTIVMKLAKPAPLMTVRPLPEIDGARAENRGILFPKDPEFSDYFVVEGQDEKSIRRWLGRDVRKALLELPDVWLRTAHTFAGVTLYGEGADADALDELVAAADAVFASRGPDGAPSLFGDEEDTRERPREARVTAPPVSASLSVLLRAAALDLALYAVAGLVVVAVLGRLPWFRPEWMFNSELVEVPEPWQGGWTTKGFGALVLAEVLLGGLFVTQAWLQATRGQSLGKIVFGARLVSERAARPSFATHVLGRSWLLALPALALSVALASPLTPRGVVAAMTSLPVVAVAVLTWVVNALPLPTTQRSLLDRVAKTRHVVATPWSGVTTEGAKRTAWVLGLAALITGAYVGGAMLELDLFLY